jgi:hypothetical protein
MEMVFPETVRTPLQCSRNECKCILINLHFLNIDSVDSMNEWASTKQEQGLKCSDIYIVQYLDVLDIGLSLLYMGFHTYICPSHRCPVVAVPTVQSKCVL